MDATASALCRMVVAAAFVLGTAQAAEQPVPLRGSDPQAPAVQGAGLQVTAAQWTLRRANLLAELSVGLNSATGTSSSGFFATNLGERAAGGLLFVLGARNREVLINGAVELDATQRVNLSAGLLRQRLDFDFASG